MTVDIESENKEWAAVAEMVATKAVAAKYKKCAVKLTGCSVRDRTMLLLHHYKKENWANIQK